MAKKKKAIVKKKASKSVANKAKTNKVATNKAIGNVEAIRQLATNTTSLVRSDLLMKLLNPGKDINYECGYPDTITEQEYKAMYLRNGAAKRVVRLLPEETWAMPPEIIENEDANETKFEKEWKKLEEDKRLFHYLQRIDVLSGIGEFGVLLMGLDDGKQLNEAVEGINEKTGERIGSRTYQLLYLKPFDQTVVTVKTKEVDVTSPRYGSPLTYQIDFEVQTAGSGRSKSSQIVHWTRLLHVADGRDSSEIYGTPRMQPVYNRLLDLRKILGGSGEMFWKGGFPGLSFETQPEPGDSPMDTDSLKDQMELYMAGLQRYLATEGISVKSLAPQVASPKDHVEINMRNIAISLGIPYRIFLGTEEAKLASSQDIRTWNKRVSQRQNNYVSPYVIRPFIDRLMVLGILSEVDEYTVNWPDLNAPTDEDKANIASTLTEALAKYVTGGVDALIPPMEYLTVVLGMSRDEAEAIEKAAEGFLRLEVEEVEEVVTVE